MFAIKTKEGCSFVTCLEPAKIKFLLALIVILLSPPAVAHANNLSITNVVWANHDSANNTFDIQFDISWDNSWRNDINHDAVWVYVVTQAVSQSTTVHPKLKTSGTNPADCSQGTGTPVDIVVPTDKTGTFIMRSQPGSGSVSVTGVKLCLSYPSGYNDSTVINLINVSGMEMVYIPTGAFEIGDGNKTLESAYSLHLSADDNNAFTINTTEKENVTCDSNANDDIDDTPIDIDGDDGIDTDGDGTVDNADFPTGYPAFYIMKYELTEGQWVSFFNLLPSTSSYYRTNHDVTGASGKNSDGVVDRNTVAWTSGDATTQRPDRAMNWLNWADLAAFCDWTCLRPVTEMEYEKACRGSTGAVYTEKAYGDTAVNGILAAEIISGAGEDGTETVSDADANACYNNITFSTGDATYDQDDGPVRSGIFAESNTNRRTSGASYYGVMELSGNVSEFVVSIGALDGREYQGSHGDGKLSKTQLVWFGYATGADWPGYTNSCCVKNATGTGTRGGSWEDATSALSVSDRSAATQEISTRANTYGGRCARTAP